MQKIILLLVLLGLAASSFAQERTTIQRKYQQAGEIRLSVCNMGMLGSFWGGVPENHLEYPAGSNHEHIDVLESAIGGVVDGDTCVSAGWAFGTNPCYELFPDSMEWDTLWVYEMGTEVDPIIDSVYSPNVCGKGGVITGERYEPRSETDFLAHYSDRDTLSHMLRHKAMGIDIYQISYSWGYPDIQDIIFFEFYMKNTGQNIINGLWIGFSCNLQVGNLNNVSGSCWARQEKLRPDDHSWYNEDKRTVIYADAPGGEDGTIETIVGWTILNVPDIEEKTFTFKPARGWDFGIEEERPDELAYKIMTLGEITPESEARALTGDAQSVLAFGPYTFSPDSTMVIACAIVGGENELDLYDNVETAQYYYNVRFLSFSPPPPPPTVTVIPGNHKITLSWDDSPEYYEDTLRSDDILRDFEGYRVYKSKFKDGPYTLIADFDKVDWYGYNRGLQHEYTDSGLVNGIYYYYTVTSYDLPDTVEVTGPKESSELASMVEAMPGSSAGRDEKVAVVPNPYRSDVDYTEHGWEVPTYAPMAGWTERDRRVQFINLPARCTIRVYTLTGDLIKTIGHNDESRGWEDWDLISRVNQAISSGIYIFSVEDHNTGDMQLGKFVVIK